VKESDEGPQNTHSETVARSSSVTCVETARVCDLKIGPARYFWSFRFPALIVHESAETGAEVWLG
jgi:hypothetical protein